MPYVYLGFLDMLQGVFTRLFDGILSPVITSVFNVLLKLLTDYIWDILCDLFLDGFIVLLKLVNFLESMFKLFSGLAVVTYNNKDTNLISVIFELNGVSKALMLITGMATAAAFLFALYATGKSMADTPFDDQAAPVTHVLKNGFKSALTFMLVPVLCTFLLQMSSAVLDQVVITFQNATGTEAGAGMDDSLFITAAQGAIKDSKKINSYSSGHRYGVRSNVVRDFNIEDIDYLMGYTCSILVILILAGACLSFIRRIFDLLILYLISPFFSATIALDGGARFKKWREVFVAKFFCGFGSIFAMKIYLLAAPVFTGNTLTFSGDQTVNGFIKIFLVIGGAWAVFKGQDTMLQILSPEAAAAAKQSSGVMAAMITGGAAKTLAGAAGGIQTMRASAKNAGGQGNAFKGGKE